MNELEQLNSLLTSGAENKRLTDLEYRLNNVQQRSQEIAEILPDAIHSLQNQSNLINALQNSVDSCVKQAIEQDPNSYVKALLPAEKVLLNQATSKAIKPIEAVLHKQQYEFRNLTKQLHELGLAQSNQNKRVERQKQNINEVKQTNIKQLKETQTVVNTQINELEAYLDKLEQVQINQHLRLDNFTKNVDELNKGIQTKQNTQYRVLHNKVQTAFKKLQTDVVKLTQVSKEYEAKNKLVLKKYSNSLKNAQKSQLKLENITEALPNAIHQATTNPALAQSLQIPVEECIQISIKQDAKKFADALFPIMGPAIRKSINESFKAIIQRINKSLEESLSPKGLMWRLQALRTGQSFSDIILQNTLVFKVEQVFLIHRETGLLIQHLHQDNIDVGDSDAVSAMFTAIQDFVRDSFAGDDAGDQRNLNVVEVGDRTVWLEHGPYAVLACVIRGDAPLSFRSLMQSSLESIHALYGSLLQNFSGDSEELKPCRSILQRTIQTEEKTESTKWRFQLLRVGYILLAILLLIGAWGYQNYFYQQRLDNYLKMLDTTPGIVVISSTKKNGKLVIYGMRDPLAKEPLQIAKKFDLTNEEIVFNSTSYHDLDKQFILQRLKRWLQPPDSIKMSFKNNFLYLTGHAEQGWIDNVQKNIHLMVGVSGLKTESLTDSDQFLLAQVRRDLAGINNINLLVRNKILIIKGYVDTKTFQILQQKLPQLQNIAGFNTDKLINAESEITKLSQQIEKTTIYFSAGTDFLPKQEHKLQQLYTNIKQLFILADKLNQVVNLHVIGNTDGVDTKQHNYQLSQKRSLNMINWLNNKGINKKKLSAVIPKNIKFGAKKPKSSARNVKFLVQHIQ
ncbi:hypothetical protein QUF50_02380 [Thiotrichales bacterium HSG1]|nr:hypothetical protein [Thiotrichales bacterium HSG1]